MNENLKLAVIWTYGVHEAVFAEVDKMSENCADCEHFRTAKFERSILRNISWGKCDKHLDESRLLLEISENLHFALEEMLGIYEDGFYRTLPDGRHCSIRTTVWRDYLLSLCEEE